MPEGCIEYLIIITQSFCSVIFLWYLFFSFVKWIANVLISEGFWVCCHKVYVNHCFYCVHTRQLALYRGCCVYKSVLFISKGGKENGKEREWMRWNAALHCTLPIPVTAGNGLKPWTGNSSQVSHVADCNPITCGTPLLGPFYLLPRVCMNRKWMRNWSWVTNWVTPLWDLVLISDRTAMLHAPFLLCNFLRSYKMALITSFYRWYSYGQDVIPDQPDNIALIYLPWKNDFRLVKSNITCRVQCNWYCCFIISFYPASS